MFALGSKRNQHLLSELNPRKRRVKPKKKCFFFESKKHSASSPSSSSVPLWLSRNPVSKGGEPLRVIENVARDQQLPGVSVAALRSRRSSRPSSGDGRDSSAVGVDAKLAVVVGGDGLLLFLLDIGFLLAFPGFRSSLRCFPTSSKETIACLYGKERGREGRFRGEKGGLISTRLLFSVFLNLAPLSKPLSTHQKIIISAPSPPTRPRTGRSTRSPVSSLG